MIGRDVGDGVQFTGLHIVLFEACSAFTRVAARTLARSPICDQLHRRLQPFCYLHDCSGCFRLERLPGGACTHWKAPPSHGAHVKRPFEIGTADVAVGGFRSFTIGICRCRENETGKGQRQPHPAQGRSETARLGFDTLPALPRFLPKGASRVRKCRARSAWPAARRRA